MASETPVEKIDLKWLVENYSIDTSDIDFFTDGCLSGVDSLLEEIYPAVDNQEQINDVSYDLTGLARGLMHNSQSFIMTEKFPKLLEAIDKISESESFSFYDGSNKCVTYKNLLIFKIISESSYDPENIYPKIFENDADREREFNFKKIIEGLNQDNYLDPSESDKYLYVVSNNYLALTNRNLGNKETALGLFKDSLSILNELGLETIWDKVSNHNEYINEDEYNLLKLAGDVKFNIAMSEETSEEIQRNLNNSIGLRKLVLSANPSYVESTSAKLALLDSYSTLGNEMINDEGFSSKRDLDDIFNRANKLSDDIIPTESIEPFLQSFNAFKEAYDLKKNKYRQK